MLSIFTLKKVLFTTVVGTGVLTPVIATSPIVKEMQHWNYDVSPLKEGLKDLTNINIYNQVSVSDFLKKALINYEAQEGLIESFSQELAKKWYLSQSTDWTSKKIKEWEEQHEEQFQNAWKKLNPSNPQRDFWDNYWGSKRSMNSFGLRLKSYELVKSFLTLVNKFDFRVNTEKQWNPSENDNTDISKFFAAKGDFVYPNKIESKENWTKVGFYPTKQPSQTPEMEKMIWGKYDFLNWSYKKWFNENLPVYFWKISWDYDQNATESELKEKYNFSYLSNNAPFRASYSFPIFSQETKEKFKSFLKKIKENNGQDSSSQSQEIDLKKQYIPIWMGDQPRNGEIIDIFNSFEKNTLGTALISSYLVGKKINNSESYSSPQDTQNGSEINKLSLKNGSINNYLDPISLFLDSSKNKTVWFDPFILRGSNKYSNHIYDVRETDSGWSFYRDTKGIHAIKLDGEHVWSKNGAKKLENLFNWFNFRNLQNVWAGKYSNSYEKLISTSENWVEQFSSYLESNFNRLFIEFFTTRGEKSSLFQTLKNKDYFKKYTNSLTKLLELQLEQKKYSKIINLRRKIIETYGEKDWELKTSWYFSKYAQSHIREGLTSAFPYQISENSERFPDQEKIFQLDFENDKNKILQTSQQENSPKEAKEKFSKYLEKLSNYYESVRQLLENSQIDLRARSDDFNIQDSQRIFIRDPIFDFLLDKLFSKKDFINYIVKEEKLLKSNFFSSNKLFVKEGEVVGVSSAKNGWDNILKIRKFPAEASKLVQSSSQNIQLASNENGQTCKLTEWWEKNNTGKAEQSFSSILKKYLFRNYLRKLGDNYFNFWIEFPEFKDSTKEKPNNNSMNDFQLFYIWQKNNLTDIKEKNSLLDFLISLDYITKNKFQNLQNSLKNQLGDKSKYHYLWFELGKNGNNEKNLASPFLLGEKKSAKKEFFESKKELKAEIRNFWKKSGEIKESENAQPEKKISVILKTIKKDQNKNPDGSDNLFNFEDLKGLTQYIKNISSFSKLEELVEKLSQIDARIWPSFYNSEVIYYSGNGNNNGDSQNQQQYTEKRIYLEDKKNALIYQLKNMNQSLYSSKIFKKEEVEKIFNFQQENGNSNSNPSASTNGGNTNELSKDLFKRKQGYDKNGYFIQISDLDFSSEEKLCSLFKILPEEVLFELLIQETEELSNKEDSKKQFFSNTYKIKPHDIKFKNHIDSRHLE